MNENREFQRSTLSSPAPVRKRRPGRPIARHSRGRAVSAPQAGSPLSKDASRLLSALAGTDAEGFVDPTDGTFVLVRKRRGTVSLGAGRFSIIAAEALARHDLAHWTASRSLRVTGAGQAHQRRRDAHPDDSPFAAQHAATTDAVVATETGPAHVRMNAEESPLDWLRRRKDRDGTPMIDDASYQAGER